MKSWSLVLLFAMASTNMALAEDLENQAEREMSWGALKAGFPGMSGMSSFAVTEAGKLRLIQLAPRYESELKISGSAGVFGSRSKNWKRQCSDLKGILEYELENKNKYILNVLINPLNKSDLANGIPDGSGWLSKSTPIETRFYNVHTDLVLSYVDGSAPLTSMARLKTVQGQLGQLLRAQSESIEQTGRLKAEMVGVDDVVCDLLTGQVKIEVNLIATFDAAYLRRQEVLSAQAIQDLHERLKAMPIADGAGQTTVLARAANLGVLLDRQLGQDYADFMRRKFAVFHGSIISPIDAAVIPLNFEAATKVARRLDDLSASKDTNQTVISIHPVTN